MKIYIPNISNTSLGGGFSFIRNFKTALTGKVEFVNTWQECDIVFVFGITTIDKGELHEAIKAGKKLVLRVDNIPRKSRNRRQTPVERLTEFGNLASLVVYQSEWCKLFAGYFIDNKKYIIINNGVDHDIYNPKDRKSDDKTYLYINYNDNPNKRFDEAIYRFEMDWREDKERHLIIAGNAPSIYIENPQYNWDLNVPAKVDYEGILDNPKDISSLMKRCDFLLYPSFAEGYPNTLLEALACKVRPLYMNREGGAVEAYENSRSYDILDEEFKVKSIHEMADEYLEEFNKLI